MIIAVTVVHVLTCFMLVLIVLLQTGKGADMGAVFGGGSSSTIFGSSGAGNLLTRVTTGAAVVFMITSLFLAYSASHRSPASILDRTGVEEALEPGGTSQAAIDEAGVDEGVEAARATAEAEGGGEPPVSAGEEARGGTAPAEAEPPAGGSQEP